MYAFYRCWERASGTNLPDEPQKELMSSVMIILEMILFFLGQIYKCPPVASHIHVTSQISQSLWT